MALRGRLAKVEKEQEAFAPAECAVCGHALNPPKNYRGDGRLHTTPIVVRTCELGDSNEDRPTDVCPGCGRRRVIRIRFDHAG